LAVLDYISEQSTPVRATELADALGVHLATLHHLLATLVGAGYVRREGRQYLVSADKVATLYARLVRDVRPSPEVLQAMERFAAETGETAYVANWDSLDVVVLAVKEGRHAIRVATLSVGSSGDAHARAAGKALLAHRSPEQLERYLSRRPLTRRTPRTIFEPDRLRAELELIREQGYAVDQEEFIPGVWCLAAPFLDGNTPPLTALSISMPGDRFFLMRDAYTASLLALTGGKPAAPLLAMDGKTAEVAR
jgi:DNA-binding IclR family transcriptional regulator